MAKCRDKSVQTLNDKGYNVVKLPRAAIEPMDWIGRDDKAMEHLGAISTVLTTTAALPATTSAPVAELSGQQTSRLDLAVGLRVLANVLQAFGASSPSLDLGFKKAKSMTFTYGNVTSTKVNIGLAGGYLGASAVMLANPIARHYLADDDTEAYLITEVLKSNEISIAASDDKGVAVDVDVPVIQGLVGTNVGVKAGSAGSTKVTVTGATPLTFAFKAFEIAFVNGNWTMQGTEANDGMSFATSVGGGPAAPSGDPVLLRPSGLLRLK
jgi:hypothetical protein